MQQVALAFTLGRNMKEVQLVYYQVIVVKCLAVVLKRAV
jgi:hypothetical protein